MALFVDLARLAEDLAAEGGRLKKRAAIAASITALTRAAGDPAAHSEGAVEVKPEPVVPTPAKPRPNENDLRDAGLFCMYLAGLPFRESDARKLSAGGALLSKAVLAASGATGPELTAAYRRHGDLGAAAFDLLLAADAAKAPSITLGAVAESFDQMATAKTTAHRAATVETLLTRAMAIEAKYLLKLMLGDMRIGVKQSLVEEAIAVAAGADVAAVRHAVMLEADLAGAVRRAFLGTLAEARMRLFHPLGFMLASPVDTPEEAVDRFTPKPKKTVAAKPKRPRKMSHGKGPPLEAGAPAGDPAALSDPAESFADVPELDLIARDPVAEAAHREPAGSDQPEAEGEPGTDGPSASPGPAIHAFLEDKYDGMRAQVHCGDPDQPGRVALYSRNREDITESFPELVEAFSRVGETIADEVSDRNASSTGPAHQPSGGAIILDGEILGWDFAKARALPFAVLSPRIGRKRISDEVRRAIPVVFMAFDIMVADGALQLDRPLSDRRNRLEALAEQLVPMVQSPLAGPIPPPKPAGRRGKSIPAAQAPLLFAGQSARGDTAQAPFQAESLNATPRQTMSAGGAAIASSGDGPIAITSGTPAAAPTVPRLLLSPARLVESAADIDRAYADARARANEGVMLKAAGSLYQPGRRGLAWVKLKRELATLDVVITGAEFGTGRRSQFLSDYTFAVRAAGPDGTGSELLNVGKAYSGVTDQEIVELTEWLKAHTLEDFGHFRTVEPAIILEVAFNNIMRSDRHRSGYALRFPRILRIRSDKPLTEIDTVERVEEVYQSQVDKPAESSGDES